MKYSSKNKKQSKITQKKIQGDNIYYLLVKGRSKKWIHYQNLAQYEDLAKEYEQEQNDINQYIQQEDNCDTREQEKKYQAFEATNLEQKKGKTVINIVFMNKSEGQLHFKVYFEDGREEIMVNKQIRYKYPQELITFYENNIEIGEKQEKEQSKD